MHTIADDALVSGLNPAQREAVLHFEGPLLVLAGAGSGKTRVLTSRIARLVGHQGVDARRILAVTFTNKAAGEMRERIARYLGEDPTGMWVGTFHAVGARLLRSMPHLVGRGRGFTIYDEDDQLAVVKRVMERRSVSAKQFAPKAILGAISSAKNALVSPSEYAKLANDPFTKAAALVYEDLESAYRTANAVDFDDLLVLPVRMLRENPAFLEDLRAKFQFILVDEYQDTNHAQYQLVKLLGGEHQNVCVVGDDTSPSMAGAAPTSATFSISRRIFRTRASCGSRRTTARRRRFCASRTVSSRPTPSGAARRCAPRGPKASP